MSNGGRSIASRHRARARAARRGGSCLLLGALLSGACGSEDPPWGGFAIEFDAATIDFDLPTSAAPPGIDRTAQSGASGGADDPETIADAGPTAVGMPSAGAEAPITDAGAANGGSNASDGAASGGRRPGSLPGRDGGGLFGRGLAGRGGTPDASDAAASGQAGAAAPVPDAGTSDDDAG